MRPRADWAVVLARGASSRMGRPKGLCRLPAAPERTFLGAIAALYVGARLPLAVVTTPDLVAPYREALARPPGADALWIERPAGGGTAATVAAALAELGGRATHLWLHPVDLPHVAPATLDLLARWSRREPRSVWVPLHDGTPGHPVVLPVAPFRDLVAAPPHGSMRALLLAWTDPAASPRAARREIAVDDPGVIADHDVPAGGEE